MTLRDSDSFFYEVKEISLFFYFNHSFPFPLYFDKICSSNTVNFKAIFNSFAAASQNQDWDLSKLLNTYYFSILFNNPIGLVKLHALFFH